MKRWLPLLAAAAPVVALVVISLRSRSGEVEPEDLTELIDRADTLVVLRNPRDESTVLFESSDRHDLEALKTSLRVERPEQFIRCGCPGTPAITLYADGEKIGQITNHHARMVRCCRWKSDARLVDAEAFLKWFDDRNIPGPREEYQAGLERDKERQVHERKWVDGMPEALRPLWPRASLSNLAPLRRALAEQIPEKKVRILALFSWYGSGAGPWSGYTSYENIAQEMLLDYSTSELLAAIGREELTERQTEGVARLFGGWTFSVVRPDDLRSLPADLRARLLEHCLASADEDKRGRARRAFGWK